jgi:hypothetical protein
VLEAASSVEVVTTMVVELGSDDVVGVDVGVELDVDAAVFGVLVATVVSAPGTNAGGGVVVTEFAAANATPPNVAIAPTPAAMLINRFFIGGGLQVGNLRT